MKKTKPIFIATLLSSSIAIAIADEPLQPLDVAPILSTSDFADETGTLWFVELSGAPLVDGGAKNALNQEKSKFISNAKKANIRFKERRQFQSLFNGYAIEASPTEIAKLRQMDGVVGIYPVEIIERPEEQPENIPNLSSALGMTGADIVHSQLGYTGMGVKVAVMDTGVDYHHPDLGGCFGPGCRVSVGFDFVGDAFNADSSSPGYNPVATPDNDPDDCADGTGGGHGTHVAGIVGANGTLKGVAPDATLGAYRVFGCYGSTTADIMLAAMERAYEDGMQVLNMSIGSSFQWPQYPTAKAATKLVNKGIVVVVSAGNSGTSGLYATGAPSVGDKVISVASFDNSHIRLNQFRASPDNLAIGFSPASASPLPPSGGSISLARTGTASTVNDACNALPANSLQGQAALIRRGTCSFHIKSLNAQNAGASAVVLYNNSAGRFSATVAGSPSITIPVVSISDAEGVTLDSRLANGPVTITWTNEVGTFANATGNLLSSFSSYGLSPTLQLKPDIGAPGGLIYSTYPTERGSFATLSGTSMAAPHTAGAVALLLQAKPNTPSQAVRSLLQNHADPKAWAGNPGLGFLDNVHRQGAGMLDIDDVILSKVQASPGKISLGETEAGPSTQTVTLSNETAAPVTYQVTHQAALATGPNTFSVSQFNAPSTAAFSATEVIVPAFGSAAVDATITPNAALADGSIFGGYLVFTPNVGESIRVPYAGFKGDYQSKVILAPTANNFPWLARLSGGSYSKQGDEAVFNLQGDDLPFFLVHFDHQVQKFRLEVFDAETGKAWHRALDEQYLPRNSSAGGFFSFAWDGTTKAGKKIYTVPNGRYVVKLSVQKALGDDDNPAHWETWTSPIMVIQRP
ncbi:S8 family serine peptidase [Permianibacter aggregans]|uniref:Peptidase inhibitor I9 n=1 Tax=Permianibacter aggregans TaxID=1510150 RepID=A0A4R6UVT4_9GAMM|nr:S8 family serine peptidase [Permianibacter aggregans]QGX41569.1 peptidase S8 [Permianibacter aggregans]TDQ51372.1 peptidase inhibitor I9 [Permianibacter aggregans]